MNHHNTTGPKTPILEWEGGGKKEKPQSQMKHELPQRDLSLSLSPLLQRRNSYATKTRSPKLKFVSDHLLQNCKSIQRDYSL
jgi:hypothetical protein